MFKVSKEIDRIASYYTPKGSRDGEDQANCGIGE
jgi:hypothetical protein